MTGKGSITLKFDFDNGIVSVDEKHIKRVLDSAKIMLSEGNHENPLMGPVMTELLDVAHNGRSHYARVTYKAGCRGPLCKLRESHHQQKVRVRNAYSRGRLENYLTRASWFSNTNKNTLEAQALARLTMQLLHNEGRPVPYFLELLNADPLMQNVRAWEAFAKSTRERDAD